MSDPQVVTITLDDIARTIREAVHLTQKYLEEKRGIGYYELSDQEKRLDIFVHGEKVFIRVVLSPDGFSK